MSKLLEQINNTERKTYFIKDLGRVVTGKTPSKNNPEDWGEEIDFITPTDFSGDGKYLSHVKRKISAEGKSRYKNMIIPPKSIVVTCIGSDMGKVVVSKETSLTNQQINSIIVDQNSFDVDFSFYVLKAMYPTLRSIAEEGGSTMPIITKSVFEKIGFEAPDLPTQKKIASILSVYDEKIENNNKILKNLEQMAQTIFNEWFVNFNFPGHEKVKMVDSEMGEIPEGWNIGQIEDLTSAINSGGTPSTKNNEYYNGEISWFSTKELQDNFLFQSEKMITKEGLDNSSAKIFPAETVVMAIYAAPTVGRLGILTKDSTFNQAAVGLIAKKEIGYEFIYLLLKYLRADLNNMANGAAQQNLNVGIVKNYKISIPSEGILGLFRKHISPIFNTLLQIQKENIFLKSQRDQLLAKLV